MQAEIVPVGGLVAAVVELAAWGRAVPTVQQAVMVVVD